MSSAKGGEPISQVWGGGKRGHQNFPKIQGWNQSLTHYVLSTFLISIIFSYIQNISLKRKGYLF